MYSQMTDMLNCKMIPPNLSCSYYDTSSLCRHPNCIDIDSTLSDNCLDCLCDHLYFDGSWSECFETTDENDNLDENMMRICTSNYTDCLDFTNNMIKTFDPPSFPKMPFQPPSSPGKMPFQPPSFPEEKNDKPPSSPEKMPSPSFPKQYDKPPPKNMPPPFNPPLPKRQPPSYQRTPPSTPPSNIAKHIRANTVPNIYVGFILIACAFLINIGFHIFKRQKITPTIERDGISLSSIHEL